MPADRAPPPRATSPPVASPSTVPRRRASPHVKLCGIVDAAGVRVAIRAGADAIGLNVVAGTPRELTLDEATELAALARASAPAAERPRIVLITADRSRDALDALIAKVRPDVVQLNGDEPLAFAATLGATVWKALRVGAGDRADAVIAQARAWRSAGAERILLDTAGGPFPGGTGTRVASESAAAVAREVPVTLAGGLRASNVADALRADPGRGRRRRERHRGRAAGRPRAPHEGRVRGRAVRQARPSGARSTARTCLRPDARPRRHRSRRTTRGRWGHGA